MLTFDYLVQRDITEKQIARKVVRKNLIRSAGCLTLPLTMMYFASYVSSLRLHEDIVNVFFLESGMRRRTDHMFLDANTAEDVWESLLSPAPGMFIDVFFNQKDIYGSLEMMNLSEDVWGPRGLVTGYNQIQGAVLFTQTRKTPAVFGEPSNCTDELTCEMCRSNKGFQTERSFKWELPKNMTCGDWPNRRLDGEEVEADTEGSDARRLHLARPEWRDSFPQPEVLQKVGEDFSFWLYPSESMQQIRQRLTYYRQRGWIDGDTTYMTIKMYIMNAELGRTRLEQLTLKFYFSHAGSIYYERDIHAIFLQLWYGFMSMGADFSFFCLLSVTTAYRLHGMWKAFLQSRLFQHLMNLGTGWEWLLIMVGWWNMFGFYKQMIWEANVIEKLRPVHTRGWSNGPQNEDAIRDFFDAATEAATGVSSLRVIYAQYSVVLMFRFFVSFGTQPRLAIVLRTMKNVLMDVFHFLFVFLPTFLAYVISASLMFGRRLENFATIEGAFGSVFRIAMESEYEWGELSEQYFWAAAVWAWTFMLLIVLLFLNMVVAIILDIYNETRETSFPGEAIWETISTAFLRTKKFRTWIKDRDLEFFLENEFGSKAMVTRQDLEERFETMPEKQKDLFFKACRTEMKWDSAKDLHKKTMLRLTGIITDALEDVHDKVNKQKEEVAQPLRTWTTATDLDTKVKEEKEAEEPKHGGQAWKQRQAEKLKMNKESEAESVKQEPPSENFLARHVSTKGGKQPMFKQGGVQQGNVKDTYSYDGPDWLQEAWDLLKQQRAWIQWANWQTEQMQWQVQRAHDSKEGSSNAKSAVL